MDRRQRILLALGMVAVFVLAVVLLVAAFFYPLNVSTSCSRTADGFSSPVRVQEFSPTENTLQVNLRNFGDSELVIETITVSRNGEELESVFFNETLEPAGSAVFTLDSLQASEDCRTYRLEINYHNGENGTSSGDISGGITHR